MILSIGTGSSRLAWCSSKNSAATPFNCSFVYHGERIVTSLYPPNVLDQVVEFFCWDRMTAKGSEQGGELSK